MTSKSTTTYLFDWGDTLMVDFKHFEGKMCDWPEVRLVEHAETVLSTLSRNHQIYLATNARDSSLTDIQRCFERVGLAQYLSGYFCYDTLGVGKGSDQFFTRIIDHLDIPPNQIVMVGDNYQTDVESAIKAGIYGIWFNPLGHETQGTLPSNVQQIHHLSELLNPVL
ncbi:HAD family hydrolase [Vibrio sp. AK197]